MNLEKQYHPVKSDNQNFFQLASIQSISSGFSVIIIGEQLAKRYGAGSAICSIIVGNLILWLVGIVVISMVSRERMNAIENFKSYVGKWGGILVALILMFAFLNWYALEIDSSLVELNKLFQFDTKWPEGSMIRFGAGLGLLSALLAIGGIRLLKWIAVIALPVLFFYHVYVISVSDSPVIFEGSWGLSFSAVVISVLALLPGVVNLPTFFRHSRSRADSYLALTLMALLITFFEVSTIWMGFVSRSDAFAAGTSFALSPFSITAFILVLLTSCNLLNIYLASACWETIVPYFSGAKGYAIIGLLGTAVYTFVQISSPVLFLEDLTNAYIASLGVVLLIAFLTRMLVRHRPRTFEKIINGTCWIVGCIAATIFEIYYPGDGVQSLLAGIGSSGLFFLFVIFVEETVWAVKKLLAKRAALKEKSTGY